MPNLFLNYILLNIYIILFRFYLDCLLPEIVDPTYKHRMMVSDIRESNKVEVLKMKNKSNT